ncbi:MAG: RNA-directed DNA polymerase, partial [Deltaproteobacteria bacterium]|nr:RNA-directed DNA polymerase [Deltaproteobacteria bacterium]
MTSATENQEIGPVDWKAVQEAGGIHNWVHAELERRGLIEDVDTSTLSAKDKKAFKARRDEERR